MRGVPVDGKVLIENVEFLLEHREAPERIATRVGYRTRGGLTRTLHRLGRRDLAMAIDRVRV